MPRTGRPPIFPTVEDFEKRNPDGFFAWCQAENHVPLFEWFAVYMGISIEALKDYMKKDGNDPKTGEYNAKKDFRPSIKRIGTRIKAEIIERGLMDKLKHDAIYIFYMKNYGYTDKQEIQADMTVNLTIGGNSDLFN